MTKTCVKCSAAKDETEFPLYGYVRRDGQRSRNSQCTPCLRETSASPARSLYERNRQLRQKYGIDAAHFDTMLAAQDGRCANAGCRATEPGRPGPFHVDHDHVTGKVRGLLCHPCNSALGMSGDGHDNARLFGLYEYAVEHAAPLIGGPDALFVLKTQPGRMAA